MEILLLAMTIVSVIVAFVTSAAAWRLSREERARSAARVAALAATASEPTPEQKPSAQPSMPTRLEVQAAAPAISSFRVQRAAAPSTRVSVAPWARAIAPAVDVRLDAPKVPYHGPAPAAVTESFLESTTVKPSNSNQRRLAVAAGALFFVIVAGGYFTIYRDDTPSLSAAASTSESPLELVSLRHERRNRQLAITGLVRNPVAAAPVEKLAAVAFLFDAQGSFLTSGRADVDFTRLAPGDESPFVITLDAPSNVARYRVSFRNDAGVVPHVDMRGQEPIARGTP